MMLRLMYFAHLRETLGLGSEELVMPEQVTNVAALKKHLAARGGPWLTLTESRNLKMAVNQQMAGHDTAIADGDEVAFFPPVTGG